MSSASFSKTSAFLGYETYGRVVEQGIRNHLGLVEMNPGSLAFIRIGRQGNEMHLVALAASSWPSSVATTPDPRSGDTL